MEPKIKLRVTVALPVTQVEQQLENMPNSKEAGGTFFKLVEIVIKTQIMVLNISEATTKIM